MATRTEQVEYLSPDDITPDPDQPRKSRSEKFIDGLAKNILQEGIGIINPIEVDANNMIVTGEMRWRAAQKAGLATMPVRRVEPPSAEVRFLRQVSENLLQLGAEGDTGTMTPMDVGRSLKRLLEMDKAGAFGEADVGDSVANMPQRTPKTTDQGIRSLARRIGVGRDFIAQRLAMVEPKRLPKVLAAKVEEGKVSFSAAREVVNVRDPEQRKAVAKRVAQQSDEGPVYEAAVRAVRQRVVGKSPEETDEIVQVIKAGRTATETARELERVAPTLGQAVDGVTKKGNLLVDHASAIQMLLRDAGSLEAFPKVQRAVIVATLERLRSDVSDFLGGVGEEHQVIEGKVL